MCVCQGITLLLSFHNQMFSHDFFPEYLLLVKRLLFTYDIIYHYKIKK